ncbi:MAG: HAD family phosphatase [Bradyrhizobiaceae bacterium]|nr:MAG: HAD family phosphatase [Bradyrhizobiaceae bacterium]
MTQIELVVSDVDGTLVTKDKRITSAAAEAVRKLRERSIAFSVTSSRPPFGMRMLFDPLDLQLPIGPFNGSSLVNRDLSVVEQHTIPQDAVTRSLEVFEEYGVDIWMFSNQKWMIFRDDRQYVPHEQNTIQTLPVLLDRKTAPLDGICKLVGVSADFDLLAKCETALQPALGKSAHAARSQNYYLDVTPPGFDKGTFVESLASRLKISLKNVATIGDMANDLPMLRKSGVSFAMGNASDTVKQQTTNVTASNAEDGFAKAIEQILKMT